MSVEQVDAMGRAVQAEPVLGEWLVRFAKAECKADGLTAAECSTP